ncbi:MAG: hypothetical protein Q9218_004077 [Villophora microphyllina]
MSFFGQSNNQQSSGFGGFGSNNNSSSAFGQSSNTGFGTTSGTSGGGLFGTSNNNSSGGGFGGFGANASTSTPFGGNTSGGFGATASSGGGLFGSNTATSGTTTGFGGFGSGNTNTGGGLFGGANKPAFGSQQPSTGGSLFGGGSNTFGSSNNQTSTGFAGAPISSALGGAVPECQGTGSTPFQATVEREGATSNQNNHYQSIAFMQPYKNYSFEELRLADYNQGRRFGNGSGQAGAFGTSTGFGGFGGQTTGTGFGSTNQSTGLFGSQATSAAPFGGNQTATSGFGSNNTGGLFGSGASKPAGAFGSTTSQPSGGGLFGSTNQSGGFGSQNNTSTGFGSNQSGGLFGSNNQQQKSGFSFGQSNNNTTSGFGASGNTGFGTNNNTSNTGGGLFGSNSTSTAFGGSQQQQTSNPFGGFGNNQQNQSQNNTGSAFGGFGNNDQNKSGGLFGSANNTANTGGALFGNNQNNQQSSTAGGGLFGGGNNNQSGSTSLFGPKPAATGTGLFGSNTTSNTGTTGLFGSNNNQGQQNQGGSLFGNTNNQQQAKPGGLFGSGTGSSLFGNNNNNQQQQGGTSTLFSNIPPTNNQQQQSTGLFGSSNNNTTSLFSNTQPQQQQASNPLQAPQAYNASIFDSNPYGNRSIFDGLPPPPQQYTGPVATPIGQKKEAKKGAVLPQYRINPHVASRFVTPQKRQQGYGFTYSTYGTPSSVSSNVSTPGGLSSSLLQGSISRGLGKSLSSNNLRRAFDADHQESLLSPGAFSAGSSRYGGTGSLKKLTIDRSLRTDLFQSPPALPSSERNDQSRQPSILKKKVSFDASTVGGNGEGQNCTQPNGVNGNGGNGSAASNVSQGFEQGPSSSTQSDRQSNGALAQHEMEQVKGNELAVINEDGNQDKQPEDGTGHSAPLSQYDPKPGDYYMKPSHEELARMSSEQKKKVSNFCIGREGCGYVVFNVPVNLNDVPLDQIFGDIAKIELRSLTIYSAAEQKPPRGKGLNVPSTIHLANSWPRAKDRKTPLFEKSGPRFNKHLVRLQRVRDTEFVSYDKETGMWVFKVQHFTTYALDYDDQASEGDNTFQTSTLSTLPDSPTPQSRIAKAGSTPMPIGSLQDSSILSSEMSRESSSPDDTFEFRRKKLLPGAFDDSFMSDDDPEVPEMTEVNGHDRPFPNNHSAPSSLDEDEGSPSSDIDYQDRNQSLAVQEPPDMVGSFPQVDGPLDEQASMPKSILKKSQATNALGTPGRLEFNESGDWAEELRRTISPRKQDRQALRESQARVMQHREDREDTTPKAKANHSTGQPGFANTMDLMNSIFPKEQDQRGKGQAKKAGQGKAFQYPYPRTLATNNDENQPKDDNAQQWHDSFKPSWGSEGTLLYAIAGTTGPSQEASTQTDAVMRDTKSKIVSEGRDVRFAKFVNTPSLTPQTLSIQRSHTQIGLDQGIPYAKPNQIPLKSLEQIVDMDSRIERSVWRLASVLFDDLDPSAFGTIPASEKSSFEYRVRKDLLSDFWGLQCFQMGVNAATSAPSAEERALDYLSANALVKACTALVEAKDFRLATLVSQLPADDVMAQDIAEQIKEWGKLRALSEFSEPIRALYEICAGNVCVCEGKKGVPLEDQVKPFVISERFGLDWQRAFGLRLWYGIRAEDPIQEAIKLFYNDMNEGNEPVKPLPLFASGTSDEEEEGEVQPEDIHWGLLKLFAASKHAIPNQSLLDIISPNNTVGNPLDFRLSFQLYHVLTPYLPFSFTSTNNNSNPQQKADQLALSFATQLESQGEWLWSIFILLHISSPAARKTAVQNTLARHAPAIPTNAEEDPDNFFSALTSEFKIPSIWIWEAKALEARSIHQDFAQEIKFLQKAGDWSTAHETLVRVVGPQCVIEEDWGTLTQILGGFGSGEGAEGADGAEEEKEKGKDVVGEVWYLGGGIYQDHLDVVEGVFDKRTLERQLEALPQLVHERGGKMGFEEGVAVREIAGLVAETVSLRDYSFEGSNRILQLPLTSEQYRRHEVALQTKHFRDLMRGHQ